MRTNSICEYYTCISFPLNCYQLHFCQIVKQHFTYYRRQIFAVTTIEVQFHVQRLEHTIFRDSQLETQRDLWRFWENKAICLSYETDFCTEWNISMVTRIMMMITIIIYSTTITNEKITNKKRCVNVQMRWH